MASKERWMKAMVLGYLLLLFVGSFVWIALLKSGTLNDAALGAVNLSLFREFQYYAFSGVIGGTLYCLRLFYWYNIHDKLNIHKWWLWYFLRPIMSGGTAVMTVLLFQSGILLIDISDSLIPKIALSFLIGYGFGKVMDKLDGLTETLFNGRTNPDQRPQEPSRTSDPPTGNM
ncbi:hypothetical protein [Effusibacillus consociatus]|uniref:Uncharacterized protein n=1 Tax=Effusibacillus consociatus TaxID=1117041 RepID=A0ABV9Q693_9BACL